MRALALVVFACSHVNPIEDISRPFKEAERAREAAKWAGTYAFSECAGANRCWHYVITVTRDGDAIITVDGDDPSRVNAKPRVHDATLTLQFVSYADDRDHQEWIPAGLGPAFRPGERLVHLVRSADAMCLRFEHLESKLDTRQLCVQLPAGPAAPP